MSGDLDTIEQARKKRHTDDYIDRTIATVRNHAGADNCWPQWANIFADEIEDLRAALARVRAALVAKDEALRAVESYLPTVECNGPRDCVGTTRGCSHCDASDDRLELIRAALSVSRAGEPG